MSKLFCDDTELLVLERLMQEPPNYRPRRHGLHIADMACRGMFDMESYTGLLDYMADQMEVIQVKNRIQEIFSTGDKELVFRDIKHRKDFYSLLLGKRKKAICGYPNYGAAVFLLSADEQLWDRVYLNVTEDSIYFKNMKLGAVSLEQYILFHAAKDMYLGTKHISLNELSDKNLIADEAFKLIVNAMLIKRYGINIIRWENQT